MSEETFLLDPCAKGVDIQVLPDGSISLNCGAYLPRDVALQVRAGLFAVLSGQFGRATTEQYLAFDLSRRTARPAEASSLSSRTPPPTMDML